MWERVYGWPGVIHIWEGRFIKCTLFHKCPDCADYGLSLVRCLRFDRWIVGNRCDGLIILQAQNLATSESPVPGNRERGWDGGIQEIRFSELYRPMGKANDLVIRSQADRKENNRCDGLIRLQDGNLATGKSALPGNRKRGWEPAKKGDSIFWALQVESYLANIFFFCHHGKRPLLDPVKYCAYYLGFVLNFLQTQNSLCSETFSDLNSLFPDNCDSGSVSKSVHISKSENLASDNVLSKQFSNSSFESLPKSMKTRRHRLHLTAAPVTVYLTPRAKAPFSSRSNFLPSRSHQSHPTDHRKSRLVRKQLFVQFVNVLQQAVRWYHSK
jgi:hypothetical protein